MKSTVQIQPKFLRMRDAPNYLGMDINRFNTEVRPELTEIPMGKQGIAFDRLELDGWAEHYMSRCGRPPRRKQWDEKDQQDFINVADTGELIKPSKAHELTSLLEQAASMKRKGI